MLPEALILLLHVALINAQSSLSLNNFTSFNTTSLPKPPTFFLPSSDNLTITIALCSLNDNAIPRVYVTSRKDIDILLETTQNPDVSEIAISDGYGVFNGAFPDGGLIGVEASGNEAFEVGVSDEGAIHKILEEPPLLGDSTSNQALLFSAPFMPASIEQPTFPNYTLPAANQSIAAPSNTPNHTLFIAQTQLMRTKRPTGCMLSSQQSLGNVVNKTVWQKDDNGWRSQWVLNGLTPLTNYTAFVVEDGVKVSGPMYFVTKSAAFFCPLVHSLPFCPGVAYAVPLRPPVAPNVAYSTSNLPSSISDPIIETLTNFTTTLTTFACGRDWYSPLVTCADCQRAYRNWLCTVSFTRCSEPSPGDDMQISAPSAKQAAFSTPGNGTGNKVLSALVTQSTSTPGRNPNLPEISVSYTVLQPCLETCNHADRMCPSFLGFRCPLKRFNAAYSYGVGYQDSGEPSGEGQGVAGATQDRYGNVWCNRG